MSSASDQVRAFLAHMERRNLAAARAMLAPGFRMVFPGPAEFHTLEELVAWGRERYQRVGKQYERFDEFESADGERIVYCFGTLHGAWLDGSDFGGIRFIDRFTVVDGLFTEQHVWNDLAEAQARLRDAAAASSAA